MKYSILFLSFCLLLALTTTAQVYTNKPVGKKSVALSDSLKNSEYPYALPIWGKKVAKLGYDLPYSAGLGINYLWQKSDLVIENLFVGFNNSPMVNLDEIVRFNGAVSEASALNIRPDIWLLPFLNIYGLLAVSKPSTKVDFGIWIPDSSDTWKEVVSYSTKANFNATSFGFGMTPTIGIGGGWMALDMNVTWTDVSALEKPVFTFVFGPRFGKSFKFKKPQQNLALWVGGFRLKLSSSTSGSIPLNELIPEGGNAGAKIDAGQQKVADAQQKVDTWWSGLSQTEQNNPINQAKYETANRALTTAGNFLNAAESAVNTIAGSTVKYSLDKRVKDMWNFLIGTQYQLNKHWMIRGELGFLGSRSQFIGGLQYRFGL